MFIVNPTSKLVRNIDVIPPGVQQCMMVNRPACAPVSDTGMQLQRGIH